MSVLALYNDLNTFLIIGALLFGIGVYGIVTRKTLIGMLISAELLLAGASINFMAFNRFTAPDPVVGQVFTLHFILVQTLQPVHQLVHVLHLALCGLVISRRLE